MSRLLESVAAVHHAMPAFDRLLAVVGAAVAANLAVVEVATNWVGLGVGIATICMIIPRAILGWNDVARARAERRAKREEALRLIAAVESECAGCGTDPAPAPTNPPSHRETSAGS